MANYVFETTTQAQAAGFTSADFLIFSNSATNAVNLSVTPAAATGLNNASITLASGSQSLVFPADALSAASQGGRLVFNDQSSLILGSTGADTATAFQGTTANDVIYGFGGADSIGGGNGNDYLYGGADADTISGGDGNDHIYGNALTTQAGATDGADSIVGGNGSDYIQGNAGADILDGGAGSDRIFGGADADTIQGGTGNDTINGNLGDDSIDGGADNDFIRGGQGNDVLLGSGGDDILVGDLGNDTLTGGTGYDALTGGAGNDLFSFVGAGDATFSSTQTNGAYANGATAVVTDLINDFQDTSDLLRVFGTGTTTTTVLHASSAASSMAQGQLIAQGLLSATGVAANSVAAVTVGSDTYLFYAASGTSGGQIDSAIRIAGINDAQFTSADFG